MQRLGLCQLALGPLALGAWNWPVSCLFSRSMKRSLTALVMFGLLAAGMVRAQVTDDPNALIWCGLDYSRVKLIGSEGFNQPAEIFPGMLVAWNSLFMREVLPDLEKKFPSLGSDTSAVGAANDKATAKQIDREDGTREEKVNLSHITDKEIASMVRSYKLKHEKGVGLVFVMDRLVKVQETGCLYVVFFDIGSRKVLKCERVSEKAWGIGFRNYWFRPVKSAVKKVPTMYSAVKSEI
jgi:hypothetical protein